MPIMIQNRHNFHNMTIMSSLRAPCNVKIQLYTNDMQNPTASKLEELVRQAIEKFLIAWPWFFKERAIESLLDSSVQAFPDQDKDRHQAHPGIPNCTLLLD
jgi:hypothetical protein